MSETLTPFLFIRKSQTKQRKEILRPVLRESRLPVEGEVFIALLPTQAWLALEFILQNDVDEVRLHGLAEGYLAVQREAEAVKTRKPSSSGIGASLNMYEGVKNVRGAD